MVMVSEQTQKVFHPNDLIELIFFALFVIKLVFFLNGKYISINITIWNAFCVNNVDILPYFLYAEEKVLYMMVRIQMGSQ